MIGKKIIATAICGVCLASVSVHAHDGATGVVKERMELMKTIGKNTKALAPMATGMADMDLAAVEKAAGAIAATAPKVADKFPKNSLSEASEAKANIWENWDKFTGLLDSLAKDARALEAAAKAGKEDAILPAFGKMTKNCKDCHTEFRQKKKE